MFGSEGSSREGRKSEEVKNIYIFCIFRCVCVFSPSFSFIFFVFLKEVLLSEAARLEGRGKSVEFGGEMWIGECVK